MAGPGAPAAGRRLWHTAGFPLSRFASKGYFSMASEFVFAPPATVSVPVVGPVSYTHLTLPTKA